MKKKIATCIAVAAVALAAQPAFAQLFKCKGPDGKVVYSDSRCEGSDKGSLKVNPNSTTPSERERAAAEEANQAREEAARDKADGDKLRRQLEAAGLKVGADSPRAVAPSGPYELTYGDKERIRSLEITVSSAGSSSEAKSAARAEMASIRSGRDARFTSEQRSRQEALRPDLSSIDAAKRREALRQFQTFNY